MKKQIPNIITLSNLICGCIAVWQALEGHFIYSAIFIFLGAFFDFFDGMTARLLKVQSAIGKELDSLSDVVTFGVAPGFIAFRMLELLLPEGLEWVRFIAFIMPALSSYRLAKFNLDERQTSSFIGLPTPANAMVWAAYGIIIAVGGDVRLTGVGQADGEHGLRAVHRDVGAGGAQIGRTAQQHGQQRHQYPPPTQHRQHPPRDGPEVDMYQFFLFQSFHI